MKNLFLLSVAVFVVFLFSGCPNGIHKQKYYKAYFPDTATNMTIVNSVYDDYNSILPETHFQSRLIFSSNRSSYGNDFDLISKNFHTVWYWETGEFSFDSSSFSMEDKFIWEMLARINKEGNQFAPYSLSYDTIIENEYRRFHLLMYSTGDSIHGYHSEFVSYSGNANGIEGQVYGPDTIPFLGDVKQQYVSFYGPTIEFINDWDSPRKEFTEMYFDKTNGNQSDIYSIDIPSDMDFTTFLSDSGNYPHNSKDILNSSANDRCPFVNGQMIVFTSDRPGGYGGYDLYYSTMVNGSWSDPVNFGEKINSPYDEFRPIIIQVREYNNDLMIFSSNRPGGLGGFDLYFVGIDKIVPIAIE